MARAVVAFHAMCSLVVCRVKLRASARAMWERLVPAQERCAGCGGKGSKWGTCFHLVGTSCPANTRQGKDSSLHTSALPDYLITWNILCLATAQMQTEIREFLLGHVISPLPIAAWYTLERASIQKTMSLKNVSHGDICRAWDLSGKVKYFEAICNTVD